MSRVWVQTRTKRLTSRERSVRKGSPKTPPNSTGSSSPGVSGVLLGTFSLTGPSASRIIAAVGVPFMPSGVA